MTRRVFAFGLCLVLASSFAPAGDAGEEGGEAPPRPGAPERGLDQIDRFARLHDEPVSQEDLARHAARVVGRLEADALRRRQQAVPGPPSAGTAAWPPKTPFAFPRDGGAHTAIVEWWYYNGHFEGDGNRYGFELCFFKAVEGVRACHVAITDETRQKFYYERFFSLPGDGKASRRELDVQYRYRRPGTDLVCWARRDAAPGAGLHDSVLHGEVGPFAITLRLRALLPPLAVNGNAVIDMPEGGDSWYYSLTRLGLEGTLEWTTEGRTETVPVTGQAWMDHQWGMFYCFRRGWDWFSFQLEDGTDYNLFAMRKPVPGNFRYGTPSADTYANRLIAGQSLAWAGGFSTPYHVEVRPLRLFRGQKGRVYATAWEVLVHPWGEAFLVKARVPDQEVGAGGLDPLPSYWEGSCDVWRRDASGAITRGDSYVEHMPYLPTMPPQKPTIDWPMLSSALKAPSASTSR